MDSLRNREPCLFHILSRQLQSDVLPFCLCPSLEIDSELVLCFRVIHGMLQPGKVPFCRFASACFLHCQFVPVHHGEWDVIEYFSSWLGSSWSVSHRCFKLRFDLLNLFERVFRHSKIVNSQLRSLCSNVCFTVPFCLVCCAGFPCVDEGSSCELCTH